MKSLVAAIALVACGHHDDAAAGGEGAEAPGAAKVAVSSPAFSQNGEIPREHTCEGADIAPPLAWSFKPSATKSFALIVDDPDAPDPSAPKMTWVHWVLVNIPANVMSLSAGAGLHPPDGAVNGTNDWKKAAWGGPCPPIGRHRYFFKVYALDAVLGRAGMTKSELLDAMKGHVLGTGQLIGTYQKHK
jgi:hypothetical protein